MFHLSHDPVLEANQALLEGDREKVLRCLRETSNSPEVMWLRAHAVETDQERIALLEQVVLTGHPAYAPLAQAILERERQFEAELQQPPDYQFWKQPTWRERLARLRQQRMWIIGIVLSLLMTAALFASMAERDRQEAQAAALSLTQAAQAAALQPSPQITPVFTPTVTALPEALRPQVSYPAGQLWFVRWELPTGRPVSMGGYDQALATPAVGAKFLAVQYKFICRQALCEAPPEAEVSLRLADGQEIRYRSLDHPVLAGEPAARRVAQDQEVYGWLVFEVPDRSVPIALLLRTGENEDDPVLELPWPNP